MGGVDGHVVDAIMKGRRGAVPSKVVLSKGIGKRRGTLVTLTYIEVVEVATVACVPVQQTD